MGFQTEFYQHHHHLQPVKLLGKKVKSASLDLMTNPGVYFVSQMVTCFITTSSGLLSHLPSPPDWECSWTTQQVFCPSTESLEPWSASTESRPDSLSRYLLVVSRWFRFFSCVDESVAEVKRETLSSSALILLLSSRLLPSVSCCQPNTSGQGLDTTSCLCPWWRLSTWCLSPQPLGVCATLFLLLCSRFIPHGNHL